jgi:tRNA 2-thiouridine synthesizing protein A
MPFPARGREDRVRADVVKIGCSQFVMSDPKLDLRGLKCPLPALFSRRALARAEPGAVIEVWTDDPMATVDVPHMCHGEGYDVVEVIRGRDFARLKLRRPA